MVGDVRAVQLLGVGVPSLGGDSARAEDAARTAVHASLVDAGLSPGDIDVLTTAGPAPLDPLGDASRRDVNRCSSGVAALHDALPEGTPLEGVEDLAADARQYMLRSSATERHLALLTAQNLAHGAEGPRDTHGTRDTVETVLASEMLHWPLRRAMVADQSAKAVAVVLGSDGLSREGGGRALRVRTATVRYARIRDRFAATEHAARLAYRGAGLGPDELHCAEIDGPTAACELAAYEALQLAPEGGSPELIESGFTALDGVLPCNPSGGSLVHGHLEGSGGLFQLCGLASQLRGKAGSRQVAGAGVGLMLARGHCATREMPVSVAILTAEE
jgi:acetyl-CoA acetyltransferase